jgi:hypothetical protein
MGFLNGCDISCFIISVVLALFSKIFLKYRYRFKTLQIISRTRGLTFIEGEGLLATEAWGKGSEGWKGFFLLA